MKESWRTRKESPLSQWNEWARDRARIIHSASFRRLQGKTQVLGVGESDFYRTRLTHSLEVAQIGSGIVANLNKKFANQKKILSYIPEANLIEALGLAHDIGHPPFGHKGEAALYQKMKLFGGFEGNGQTLRICSLLGEASEKNGLNLCRRTLLGLLKYPNTYNRLKAKNENSSKKPPKCIMDTEAKTLDWILNPLKTKDKELFTEVYNPAIKKNDSSTTHLKTKFKSFDCSIMELSDDIAYAIHDLEDAIALKIITKDAYCSWLEKQSFSNDYISDVDHLFGDSHSKRKQVISKLVHRFIDNISIKNQNLFQENLIDLQAFADDEIKNEIQELKDLTYTMVIKKHEIKTLEYKGGKIISDLFSTINENREELLPEKYISRIEKNKSTPPERFVCDFISGMTDNYASSLYDRLFTTNSGSIFTKL
ncbi:deoxyguanosinetriphosphate triphosphohydrolase [Serratia sp. AS12]|uniref:anti-phage deoxyguanosine triphosphatase n=1 Tax=Serratia TaxID=613 RepID=UPI00020E97EA|nr:MULTISPECIES: anti-phage deoxyguanosine triphosphatase [Serratia]AEF44046.1 deoxyguanosinetriphosphate triphosphohydrolase [Serratia plymuthica AS9]AEF48998.1 deoxyguanosinetriphosphate triphosphohydrolase [Serratia sp. AS12]AEG26706.1 deoxyguanosinetriphosphate triphosphohydrolase [Serratia sp. AS13]UTN97582.1 dGTPase [Serratia plymuthica]